jgi:antitoxin VapB
MDTAKIFTNGKSQAVRLPKEFRFEGKEVFIKRVGNTVVLIPKSQNTLETWFLTLKNFSEDFMEERVQPPQQIRENF